MRYSSGESCARHWASVFRIFSNMATSNRFITIYAKNRARANPAGCAHPGSLRNSCRGRAEFGGVSRSRPASPATLMCTVTLRCGAGSLLLTMNRDERYDRAPEEAPRRIPGEPGRPAWLAPFDCDAGGPWVGVNERGVARCLLNG